MKPIRIVLSPTRSRPLNVFLGLVLLLVALLLLLSLATYRASDPSLNTASGEMCIRDRPGGALSHRQPPFPTPSFIR